MTCGLRNLANPTSDNLSPQETTKQDAPEVGEGGGDLSCPGRSAVVDEDGPPRTRSNRTQADGTVGMTKWEGGLWEEVTAEPIRRSQLGLVKPAIPLVVLNVTPSSFTSPRKQFRFCRNRCSSSAVRTNGLHPFISEVEWKKRFNAPYP